MAGAIVALAAVFSLAVASCSSSLEGKTAVVDFRVPECQNASYVERDDSTYKAVGSLPGDWEGLTELDVEIILHSGDRITVEDENGRVAEFVELGGDETTECVNW